jgi:hypothetical protein
LLTLIFISLPKFSNKLYSGPPQNRGGNRTFGTSHITPGQTKSCTNPLFHLTSVILTRKYIVITLCGRLNPRNFR